MSEPLERLLRGRTLAGRYRLGDVLGRGGMSAVLQSRDIRLNRDVAVKILTVGAEHAENARPRFRREAASAAGIPSHPNVVQIFDFGTDEELGLEFIVMELLRGRDLARALRDGALDPDLAGRVVLDAARGVAAGHRAGIIHRDVKPANVFLVGADERIEAVKILDFGIAKAMETDDPDLTATGAVPHSPSFATPEQLESGRVTAASDVFQLGLIAFEAWSGTRPFPSEAGPRLTSIRQGIDPDHPGWARIPERYHAAVARALSPEARERFRDAREFLEAMEGGPAVERDAPAGEGDAGDRAPWEDETRVSDAAPGTGPDETIAAPVRPSGASGTPRNPLVHRLHPAVLGAGLALLVFVLLVVILPRTGDPGDRASPDDPATDPTRAAMYAQAMDNVEPPPAEADSVAIMRILADVHAAWEAGDLVRHTAHFSDQVFFHGEMVTRGAIREEREQLFERFPAARIDLADIRVDELDEGEAEVSLVRDWRHRSRSEPWRIRADQRYRLVRQDGAWRIVLEEDTEILHLERPREAERTD